MTYETVFSLINLSVMPAWALLILLPKAKITRHLVHSALYPVALGLFYLVAMGLTYAGISGGGGDPVDFTTIEGVAAIFSTPMGVLIGWSHYLVFDLFVGAWIGRDALRRGVSHWLVAPATFLTFMLGPVGALIYFVGRALMGKGASLEEVPA